MITVRSLIFVGVQFSLFLWFERSTNSSPPWYIGTNALTSLTTKSKPHKVSTSHKTTKIGPYENKWFHSINQRKILVLLDCMIFIKSFIRSLLQKFIKYIKSAYDKRNAEFQTISTIYIKKILHCFIYAVRLLTELCTSYYSFATSKSRNDLKWIE